MRVKRAGFTLMEVVIVLAVIAILSAIVIPNFTGYTERARLRSDIQSARAVQSAADLYRAEVGRDAGADAKSSSVETIIEHLAGADYLNGSPELQTDGAKWAYDAATKKIRIDITACSDGVKRVALSEIEKSYVIR